MPSSSTPPKDGQAPAAGESQDDTAGSQVETPEGDGGTSLTDVVALQKELTRAREDAAKFRAELKGLKDAQKAAREGELSETERLTAKVQELETKNADLDRKLREQTLSATVTQHAVRLGIVDPEAAVKLLDKDDLEVDDDGVPQNVETALKNLLREKPYLVSKTSAAPPAGGTNASSGAQGAPPPKLTADEMAAAQKAGMDPARYADLKGVKTLADWQRLNAKP